MQVSGEVKNKTVLAILTTFTGLEFLLSVLSEVVSSARVHRQPFSFSPQRGTGRVAQRRTERGNEPGSGSPPARPRLRVRGEDSWTAARAWEPCSRRPAHAWVPRGQRCSGAERGATADSEGNPRSHAPSEALSVLLLRTHTFQMRGISSSILITSFLASKIGVFP